VWPALSGTLLAFSIYGGLARPDRFFFTGAPASDLHLSFILGSRFVFPCDSPGFFWPSRVQQPRAFPLFV